MKKQLPLVFVILLILVSIALPHLVLAGPKSSNYELKSYDFGNGGTDTSSSSNYKLNGAAGESDNGSGKSTNYSSGNGLSYSQLANTPATPALSNNGGQYYNKLTCTLNTGSNPTDAQFLINISTDSFASDTTHYVQADGTIGTSQVWQTNSSWGATGFSIIGLTPGTTYSVRVSARQGNFTQSPYSSTTAQATANPTLSFSFTPSSVSLNNMTPANITTSNSTVTLTLTTNGSSGASVYVKDSNAGLHSSTQNYTITSVSNDLTAISEGYGIQTTAVSQSTGGPMESLSPFNVSSNTVGSIQTTEQAIFDTSSQPVNTGQGTFQIKAKPSVNAPPGTDYSDIITLISATSL